MGKGRPQMSTVVCSLCLWGFIEKIAQAFGGVVKDGQVGRNVQRGVAVVGLE